MSSKKKLAKALRGELVKLWSDLESARAFAIPPGTWSMQCEDLEGRIKELTQLVGAMPWEEMPITLLEDGVYQRIHADLGIDATVDMDRVAEVRAKIEAQHTEVRKP